MTTWEAPAKVNLSLQVARPDESGLHPVRSLIQTIEWCDLLVVEEGEDDQLRVEGADLPLGGDNLVWRAVARLRQEAEIKRPAVDFRLTKSVAVAAGLGGGSSDAAAALLAYARLARISPVVAEAVAPQVGADVPFLMVGGTAWMEGYGERLTALRFEPDYSLAVVVPPFELGAGEVYRAWDRREGPSGPALEARSLPPSLRELGPLRNDLTPAALTLAPDLADWIADLGKLFERRVAMSGSGPALFAYFSDLDEATSALSAVPARARARMAAMPRPRGAAPKDG